MTKLQPKTVCYEQVFVPRRPYRAMAKRREKLRREGWTEETFYSDLVDSKTFETLVRCAGSSFRREGPCRARVTPVARKSFKTKPVPDSG